MNKEIYTIDAEGRALGRVATEAAVLLMGKNLPSFARNIAPNVEVNINNASKIKTTPQKLEDKIYQRYSGYPGGRKERTMQQVIDKKGYEEIFKKAVRGMLPSNKLRPVMLKNLIITD